MKLKIEAIFWSICPAKVYFGNAKYGYGYAICILHVSDTPILPVNLCGEQIQLVTFILMARKEI